MPARLMRFAHGAKDPGLAALIFNTAATSGFLLRVPGGACELAGIGRKCTPWNADWHLTSGAMNYGPVGHHFPIASTTVCLDDPASCARTAKLYYKRAVEWHRVPTPGDSQLLAKVRVGFDTSGSPGSVITSGTLSFHARQAF